MSLLEQVQRGKSHAPPRILLYGTEGIGKSTLAAQAPHPIFIPTEDGLHEIDCEKLPLATSTAEIFQALSELAQADHPYETVVIDSLDWLERMIWDDICRQYGVSSIEKVDGGYSRGFGYALPIWRKLIDALAQLHSERHMLVFLTAHAKVERFEDPETSAYDRYSPRLHKYAAALLSEWCDAVLFATRKIRTQTEDAGFNRKRATAHTLGDDSASRILKTVGGPACVAKNRYRLPAELPLDWGALLAGLTQS
jgi:hypothetical protein